MKVITRHGWFKPDGTMFDRLEPWTTPQDLVDDLFDVLPSSMIIVEPPAGYQFKKGASYSGGDFRPNVPFTGQAVGAPARWPTKVDVERIPVEGEAEAKAKAEAEAKAKAEAEREATEAEAIEAGKVIFDAAVEVEVAKAIEAYKAFIAAEGPVAFEVDTIPVPDEVPSVVEVDTIPVPDEVPSVVEGDKVADVKKRLRRAVKAK